MGGAGNTKRPRGADRRGRLAERPFTFLETRDGKFLISRDNRLVTTLAGQSADKFRRAAAGLDDEALQLLLARVTGHYRHGNER